MIDLKSVSGDSEIRISHQNSPSQYSTSETSTSLEIHSILTEAETLTVPEQYICSELLYGIPKANCGTGERSYRLLKITVFARS